MYRLSECEWGSRSGRLGVWAVVWISNDRSSFSPVPPRPVPLCSPPDPSTALRLLRVFAECPVGCIERYFSFPVTERNIFSGSGGNLNWLVAVVVPLPRLVYCGENTSLATEYKLFYAIAAVKK